MIQTQFPRFAYFLVSLLILGVFFPGVNGGFLLDDYANFVTNTAVQLNFSDSEFFSKAWFSGVSDSDVSRPLSMLVFALEHAIFGSFAPYNMKLINICIHILNGLLLASLIRMALTHTIPVQSDIRSHKGFGYIPLFVFAVWALSPINIGNVLYIVQRMNLLSSLSVILSLNIYFYGRWYLTSKNYVLMCFILAIVISLLGYWFKDNALLAIFFITAYELADKKGYIRSFVLNKNWYFRLISLAVTIALILYSVDVLLHYLTGYEARTYSWQERTFIQPQVLATYLAYSFIPIPDLARFYHDGLILFSGHPAQVFWLIACLVIVLFAIFRIFINSDIFLLFTVGWFFIFHLMESTFLALEPAYNHRNYLPLAGPVLGLVYCVFKSIIVFRSKLNLTLILIGGYGVSFLLAAILQSMIWGNNGVFLEYEADKEPASPRAQFIAGYVIMDSALTPNACYMAKARFYESVDADQYFIGGLYGLWEYQFGCGGDLAENYWQKLEKRLLNAPLSATSFLYLTEMLSDCEANNSQSCSQLKSLVWRLMDKKGVISSAEKRDIYMLQYTAAKADRNAQAMETVLRVGLKDLPYSFPLTLGILQLLFDLNKCVEYEEEIARLKLLPELFERITAKSQVLGKKCGNSSLII